MYTIQLFDYFAYSLTIILICLIEIFMVFYCYGTEKFVRDVSFMLNKRTLNSYWIVCWRYMAPSIMTFVFITVLTYSSEVTYNGVRYPDYAYAIGWLICLSSLLFIPGYFIFQLLKSNGTCSEVSPSEIELSESALKIRVLSERTLMLTFLSEKFQNKSSLWVNFQNERTVLSERTVKKKVPSEKTVKMKVFWANCQNESSF